MTTQEEKSIDQARADLQQLKDELRVKLDLARKDAKKAGEELEPALNKIAQMDAADKADARAKEESAEFKKAGAELQKEIEEAAAEIKNSFLKLKKKIAG
jgi:multidrug resistance efflux pump